MTGLYHILERPGIYFAEKDKQKQLKKAEEQQLLKELDKEL